MADLLSRYFGFRERSTDPAFIVYFCLPLIEGAAK